MSEKYPVLPEEDDYAKYPAQLAEDDDSAKYPVPPQPSAPAVPPQPAPRPQPAAQRAKSGPSRLLIGIVVFLIIIGAGLALSKYPGLMDGDRDDTDSPRRSGTATRIAADSGTDNGIGEVAATQSAYVNATDVTAGDYKIRTYRDGTCEIIGYNGSRTNLSIPKELNGYAVTAIGDRAFYSNKTIENVSIQTGVTRIGDSAFSSCTALGIVYLPSTLTAIDDNAFSSCSSLHTIRLPEGLATIGDWAFSRCESLTTIRIPSTVTTIGDCAFNACNSMQSYTVEYGNTRYSSLQNCLMASNNTVLLQYPVGRSDKRFTVPASVSSIGVNAFTNAKLESVTIPEGGSVIIGDYAFSWCMSLKEIRLPVNVTSIGQNTFTGSLYATLYVASGSYAERFAKQAGLDYAYLP